MRAVLACLLLLVLVAPAGAAEFPYVQAHRGGPLRLAKPALAEETLAAFHDAWEVQHVVLELDVKLSADRVPVVIHDDSLDRTTACTGTVASKTWDELRAQCPSDVIGIGSATAKAAPPVPMASLRDALSYAKQVGAPVNMEIKNIPGEADFDSSPAYAETVLAVVEAVGFPLDALIVQSFYPPNLDVAEERLPGVQTAFLTFTGDAGAEYSATRGYEWWSPSWPVTKDAVDRAHSLGVRVVPWTIDTPDDVAAAQATGADAVITNDPTMAREKLGIPGAPLPAVAAPPPSSPPAAHGGASPAARTLRCRAVPGARRINVGGAAASCPAARRLVRAYLRGGCRRSWRCRGRTRVTVVAAGATVRFQRQR